MKQQLNPQVKKKKLQKENRLNLQLLRVSCYRQLRHCQDAWLLSEEQLCEFFSSYTLLQATEMGDLLKTQGLKLVRNQNKIYFGQIREKRKQGIGVLLYKQNKIYEGQFNNNVKEGSGCEVYANGNVYIGSFSQNKKHGMGCFYWFSLCEGASPTIERYEGGWWGGLPDGEGQHYSLNGSNVCYVGDYYVGGFKNGLKHGQGIQFYSNKDRYKGQFINGLPQGYGEYTFADGEQYKGDFKQGYRNGYGVWEGKKEVFKGHYLLDKKHGYGVYDWGNDYVYKGVFFEDVRQGEGTLLHRGEVIYKGKWRGGERVEQSKRRSSMTATTRNHTNDFKEQKSSKLLSNDKTRRETSVEKNIEKFNFKQTLKSNEKNNSKNASTFLVNFNQIQQRKNHRKCQYCQAKRTQRRQARLKSFERPNKI